MAKSKVLDEASQKDQQKFQKYLAEDEELVVASGYGKNYLRHRFVYYIMLPGIVFWILGALWGYFFWQDPNLPQVTKAAWGLLIGMGVAIIFALLKTILVYHAHRYLLTTRRVIIKEGFFSVKLITALYDKITHIEVDQSLMDRMIMKHGNIIINTAGGNSDELALKFIDNPVQFKNLLERLINREREQFSRGGAASLKEVEGELVE